MGDDAHEYLRDVHRTNRRVLREDEARVRRKEADLHRSRSRRLAESATVDSHGEKYVDPLDRTDQRSIGRSLRKMAIGDKPPQKPLLGGLFKSHKDQEDYYGSSSRWSHRDSPRRPGPKSGRYMDPEEDERVRARAQALEEERKRQKKGLSDDLGLKKNDYDEEWPHRRRPDDSRRRMYDDEEEFPRRRRPLDDEEPPRRRRPVEDYEEEPPRRRRPPPPEKKEDALPRRRRPEPEDEFDLPRRRRPEPEEEDLPPRRRRPEPEKENLPPRYSRRHIDEDGDLPPRRSRRPIDEEVEFLRRPKSSFSRIEDERPSRSDRVRRLKEAQEEHRKNRDDVELKALAQEEKREASRDMDRWAEQEAEEDARAVAADFKTRERDIVHDDVLPPPSRRRPVVVDEYEEPVRTARRLDRARRGAELSEREAIKADRAERAASASEAEEDLETAADRPAEERVAELAAGSTGFRLPPLPTARRSLVGSAKRIVTPEVEDEEEEIDVKLAYYRPTATLPSGVPGPFFARLTPPPARVAPRTAAPVSRVVQEEDDEDAAEVLSAARAKLKPKPAPPGPKPALKPKPKLESRSNGTEPEFAMPKLRPRSPVRGTRDEVDDLSDDEWGEPRPSLKPTTQRKVSAAKPTEAEQKLANLRATKPRAKPAESRNEMAEALQSLKPRSQLDRDESDPNRAALAQQLRSLKPRRTLDPDSDEELKPCSSQESLHHPNKGRSKGPSRRLPTS